MMLVIYIFIYFGVFSFLSLPILLSPSRLFPLPALPDVVERGAVSVHGRDGWLGGRVPGVCDEEE